MDLSELQPQQIGSKNVFDSEGRWKIVKHILKGVTEQFIRYSDVLISHDDFFVSGSAIPDLYDFTSPKDFDLFLYDTKLYTRLCKRPDVAEFENSAYLWLNGIKFNIVPPRSWGTHNQLRVKKFDFYHLMSYYTFDELYFTRAGAYMSKKLVETKQLIYNESTIPRVNAIARALKFKGRGYTIQACEMAKIVKALRKVKISDSEIENQLNSSS